MCACVFIREMVTQFVCMHACDAVDVLTRTTKYLAMYECERARCGWMCACEVCQNKCVYIIQKVDRTHVKHTNLFFFLFSYRLVAAAADACIL